MPPTPEDIDAARAQPHPDDVKAAQIVANQLDSLLLLYWGSVYKAVPFIADAISAARERGAREERERLKCKITDTIETSIGLMFDEEHEAEIRSKTNQ